jgi:tetratricopeptide (TPR) repeat protein
MLKATVVLTAFLACFALRSADIQPLAWGDDLPAAKAAAAREKKDVLILFTGFDWCQESEALRAKVVESDAFKASAPANFVLVAINFARNAKEPEETIRKNIAISVDFDVHILPAVFLMDKDGMVFWVASGPWNGTAAEFVQKLASMQEVKKRRDEAFADAEKLAAGPRALLYHTALVDLQTRASVFSGISDYGYEKIIAKILEGDPLNAHGLRIGYEYRNAVIEAKCRVASMDLKAAIDALDRFAKKYPKDEWYRQSILIAKAQICSFIGDEKAAKETLVEVVSINSDTEQGRLAKQILDSLAKPTENKSEKVRIEAR